jgi:hypothetical protein
VQELVADDTQPQLSVVKQSAPVVQAAPIAPQFPLKHVAVPLFPQIAPLSFLHR